MRSIKPGRGPSMMGGFAAIGSALFGIIWTVLAFSIGAGPFGLFGIIFIAMAIGTAVYNFKNATSPNRYSIYDITEHGEEPDPLNVKYGNNQSNNYPYNNSYNNNMYGNNFNNDYNTPQATPPSNSNIVSKFCPYCGAPAEANFEFCNCCGKKLP